MFKKKLAMLLSATMLVTSLSPVSVFAEPAEVQAEALEEDLSAEEEAPAEVEDTAFPPAAEEEETLQEAEVEETISEEYLSGEEAAAEKEVKSVLSEDEKSIAVTATGIDPKATVVYFPSWSEVNGQDDLEWVSGTKQTDGSWTATVTVKKHNSIGKYFIHCYQTVDGKQTFFERTEVTVSAPEGTVIVENLDEKKGTFTARLKDLNVPSGVTKVEFPIWGSEDGQNDLVWHQAIKDGEDYIVEVDASQHGNENGLYQIHCYLTDGNGIRTFVNKTTATIAMETGLTATLSKDEKTIRVVARGINSKAASVTFPVWSEANGQDDLKWISAKKDSTGVWSADIAVKGHKDAGRYLIHCYQTVDGKQTFFERTEVTVSEAFGAMSVENVDAVKGVFTAKATDLKAVSGISKVEFQVWAEENGQNDLVWHEAVKNGDTYSCQIDAGQHEYESGVYQIRCYVTDGNDIKTLVGSDSVTFALEKGLTAELSKDEKTIKVVARGINPKATTVYFPVWSEKNGQDDLEWVAATKEGTGVWTATVTVKGHKNPGLYNIHCYQTAGGKQSFFEKTSVTVAGPAAKLTAGTPDPKTGSFEVSISELSVPSGIKNVQVAVWGAVDGQNDLVWHKAVKSGDEYIAVISAAEHKFETGSYNVHAYVTDQNDFMVCTGKATVDVSIEEGVSTTVAADQMTASVQYIGPKASQSLKVAVWSEKDGQDDLIWYDMKQNGNGSSGTVKITNHKTSGTYNAHVYTKDNKLVGKTTFTIDPIAKATVTVSAIDGNKGTFKVTVSGLSTPSDIDRVSIPVWPNGDQGKINWYSATRSGDNFVATVNVEKHSREFGHYDVHVYAYAKNGVWNFVGSTAAELAADKYMYVEETGTYTRRVWMVGTGSDATAVTFKTWSSTNGQDDLVEYAGKKSGNKWYADIQSKQHKHGGNYTTEGYVTTSAGTTKAGSVSYTLAKEGEAKNQQMYQYAQGFSSDTGYLILVNRALHRVAIYQGSKNNWKEIKYWPCVVGKPSTPTPTGTFKIKGRFNYFGDGHLCWWCTQIEGYYYFHTVLYYTDTAPIRVLDGTMDAAASAGCIRLEEPNARWIYTTIPRGTTVHIYN